jgi:hypothetical protein
MRAAHMPMKILRVQVNRKVVSQKMLQLSADRGTCLDLVAVYPSTDALWARCQAQTHHLSCRTGRLNNCIYGR